ncbi:phosphoglycerate dehydrogenase [Marinilactibacillus psychrotolerans]|uniref:Phosphoglycerate dehydrogenase n=2 Tax=Marinilactibacillus psychrotolerans TaxID=191770 RepID=A0AAV3WXL4_9LACT|nr:phosphoglycerate dehydrogenase [Marinilactibacillus psychrotolerans]SDD13141.1 Phosphoglycerate dehydrogenase [Marinilactibacillus psychrotolerans]SJN22526.1 D-3-phosphoglycerate dehydrogenase [Marinilactibacillus psychrotolerans 42ea]GEL67641.1 2-hydroxyacid dehydrogenase [Marinilactibacillus psychrotolerans]GEQ33589.1 D-3-phosphoglycerate dehydrogenase [Marinilactibacillus psychrotolerans]GEQ36511.1 D-3-phosphoglycerate dehydrogenase [Marinilactibacillus psychrotolerans]
MTNTILSWRKFTAQQEEKIKALAPDYKLISSLEEADNLEDIEVVYGWNSEEGNKLIDDSTNQVKWIQVASAGVDYLDLEKLEKQAILLTNSSGIHSNGIAESVFGMLLHYTRGMDISLKAQMKNEWISVDTLLELKGKTMMIVGTGEIGKQTGKVAQAFDMKTIGINRSGGNIDYMNEQHTQDDLKKVIGQADIVVNILPLTEETDEMFNKDLFKAMKEQSIFINVGRGGTVDTDALLEALDSNIAYAGLDVFHEEPLPSDHPLWNREDVLITPHIAGRLEDYSKSLFPIFEKNLKAYMNGEALPINLVDYTRGY